MTKPNAVLAYEVLDAIDKHPHALNMYQWAKWVENDGNDEHYVSFDKMRTDPITLDDLTADACGTQACFAGWAVALSGYSINPRTFQAYGGNNALSPGFVAHLAHTLLGINAYDATTLFRETNGYELIHERVRDIFGPDPRPQDGTPR